MAHDSLGLLLFIERTDIDGAEAAYRASIAADPGCADGHWHLGWLLEEETEDEEGVEAAYRAAIAADPGCADAHSCLRGLLHYRQVRLFGWQSVPFYCPCDSCVLIRADSRVLS